MHENTPDSSQFLSSLDTSNATGLNYNERYGQTWSELLRRKIDEDLISGFHPSLFVLVMGTGMASGLLYTFPYQSEWLSVCGLILWGVAIFIFIMSVVCMIASIIKEKHKFVVYHTDPSVAPFMGCIAMGYGTLLSMLIHVTGKAWIMGIWVLWWVQVTFSLYSFAFVFFYSALAKRKEGKNYTDLSNFHAVYLLPLVTLSVAAANGGLFVSDLPTINLKVITIIICFIMWSNAVAMGFIVITIYFGKLIVFKVPPTNLVFTGFLPIGLLGQGGFGMLLLGANIYKLTTENYSSLELSDYLSFVDPDTFQAVDCQTISFVIGSASLFFASVAAMFVISFGHYMCFLAVISTLSKIAPFSRKYNKEHIYSPSNAKWFQRPFIGLIKFNNGFWAMTFPLGTMSLACTEFYNIFNGMKAFKIVGATYGVTCIIVVLCCLTGTLFKILRVVLYIVKVTTYDEEA